MHRHMACVRRPLVTIILLIGFFFTSPPPVDADTPPSPAPPEKTMLILNSYTASLPWQRIVIQNIIEAIETTTRFHITYHLEFTDLTQLHSTSYQAQLLDFYKTKYSAMPPDIVLSIGFATTRFLIDVADNLFENIPIVYVSTSTETPKGADRIVNMTGIAENVDIRGTLETNVTPSARHPPDIRYFRRCTQRHPLCKTSPEYFQRIHPSHFLHLSDRPTGKGIGLQSEHITR